MKINDAKSQNGWYDELKKVLQQFKVGGDYWIDEPIFSIKILC